MNDVLHVICTRVGDGSRRSEEIVKKSRFAPWNAMIMIIIIMNAIIIIIIVVVVIIWFVYTRGKLHVTHNLSGRLYCTCMMIMLP